MVLPAVGAIETHPGHLVITYATVHEHANLIPDWLINEAASHNGICNILVCCIYLVMLSTVLTQDHYYSDFLVLKEQVRPTILTVMMHDLLWANGVCWRFASLMSSRSQHA